MAFIGFAPIDSLSFLKFQGRNDECTWGYKAFNNTARFNLQVILDSQLPFNLSPRNI